MRTYHHPASLILLTLVLLASCSTVVDNNASGAVITVVYPLTPQRADTAIRQAIEAEHGSVHRELLGSGRIGYRFTTGTAPDTDIITAEALRDPEGGYLFEISNRGTTPQVGVAERDKLLELIQNQAASLALP